MKFFLRGEHHRSPSLGFQEFDISLIPKNDKNFKKILLLVSWNPLPEAMEAPEIDPRTVSTFFTKHTHKPREQNQTRSTAETATGAGTRRQPRRDRAHLLAQSEHADPFLGSSHAIGRTARAGGPVGPGPRRRRPPLLRDPLT
tara:strand:+ start:281 stop:709 length:429 start_codon:yes stop_codon:yes gene_type:complete